METYKKALKHGWLETKELATFSSHCAAVARIMAAVDAAVASGMAKENLYLDYCEEEVGGVTIDTSIKLFFRFAHDPIME